MARKSNKTAHVLNLLSGQDSGGESEKETEQAKAAAPEAAPEVKPEPSEEQEPAAKASTASPAQEVPSNISIIDSAAKENDPVAEKIREELLKDLGEETEKTVTAETEEVKPEPAVTATASATVTVSTAAAPEPAPTSPEPAPEPEEEEETLELAPEPEEEPEASAEPEPDYVMLNVMERVVKDNIIYFMKQFEVCTCDRCRADTIALTLNGLPAKYQIVDRSAVDPLSSYYASRLISQVTVEALKACTQVKENPRH